MANPVLCVIAKKVFKLLHAKGLQMFKVQSYKDKNEWFEILSSMSIDDVFFSPDYLKSNELIFDGDAECFVFEVNNSTIAYPYIKRTIPGTDYFDIISAYGYGGSVSNSNSESYNSFNNVFCEYCRNNGIVSEFIRFHPFFENHSILRDSLSWFSKSPVVFVDYFGEDFCLNKYVKKEVIKKVKKAKKNEVTIIDDEKWIYYDNFIDLYKNDMILKGASNFYFFDNNFFYSLRDLLFDKTKLFLAFYEKQLIGGHLILFGSKHSYNYLSCSDQNYLNSGVNDLLQYRVLEWAFENKMKKHLLGGGKKAYDSLFITNSNFLKKQTFSTMATGFTYPICTKVCVKKR